MTNYYETLLDRQYDYQEMCERQEIEREQAEAVPSCCPQCAEIDAAYTRNCDNCGKPIPLSEAGALCEECDERAEQERYDADLPTYLQLGELPHGGWRRS